MVESIYDGSASNGSLLDNLIRSSLESGIPRDRVIAEARGNATSASGQQQPENLNVSNSKVLIDQLCRNTRPLPRTVQQDNSCSEDEGKSISRPDRIPTVDLSSSPRAMDEGSDRGLASPPTPMSLSRLSNSGRDDDNSRSSREREVIFDDFFLRV